MNHWLVDDLQEMSLFIFSEEIFHNAICSSCDYNSPLRKKQLHKMKPYTKFGAS